ncbi:MAG TPA: hypothetical protein VI703_12155 [Anaerolineales bacterium]|nr:hypothetical protein [Anaerolineales bacterium]
MNKVGALREDRSNEFDKKVAGEPKENKSANAAKDAYSNYTAKDPQEDAQYSIGII